MLDLLDVKSKIQEMGQNRDNQRFAVLSCFTRLCCYRFVRSEKWQTESSPNFSNFCPEFPPEFCSENFEEFSCFASQETETRKNSPKIPALFQCKIPRQMRKNYSQESRQSKICRQKLAILSEIRTEKTA